MGTYINPGNSGFAGIRNDIYVDKSGLISLINQTIDTPRCLTCVADPAALENPSQQKCCVHIMIKLVIPLCFLTIWRFHRKKELTAPTGSI